MPITALPTPPSRQRPSTFAAEGDAFLASLPTFVTEANALAVSATASEDAAAASEAAAAGSANFKGEWSSLTGALAIPATVWHDDTMWLLLSNLANVTTKEPGVAVEWEELLFEKPGDVKVSASDLTAKGYLELDGSTVLQSAYSALFTKLGTQPAFSFIVPSASATLRTAYYEDDTHVFAYLTTSTKNISVYQKSDWTVVTTITAAQLIKCLVSNSTHVFVGLAASPWIAIYRKSDWGSETVPTLSGIVSGMGIDSSYVYLNHNLDFAVIDVSTLTLVAGTVTAAQSNSLNYILHDSNYVYLLDTSYVRVIAKSNLTTVGTLVTHSGHTYSQSSSYLSVVDTSGTGTLTIIKKSTLTPAHIVIPFNTGSNYLAVTEAFTAVANSTWQTLAIYDNLTQDLIHYGALAYNSMSGVHILASDKLLYVVFADSFSVFSDSLQRIAYMKLPSGGVPRDLGSSHFMCSNTNSPYSHFVKIYDYDITTEFKLPIMTNPPGLKGYIKT